jgi:glutamyl-tRNA synthetase
MVKTRFAPSPTGNLHLGNVRTALFAYLYAKHTDGHFILRIEDTDKERSNKEYNQLLMDDLRWLGLDWDEGPEVGGDNPPYYQSEREEIYSSYAKKLIDEGRAYYCYCNEAELEERKNNAIAEGKPPHYDGKCKNLSPSEKQKFIDENRKSVVRFSAYDEDFSFKDIVKGEVNFPRGMVGDFVIVRSNGVPVYNFAVTVDDYTMGVTHVLRAEEHLSNTVRQLMIYKALGVTPPAFAHMALVLGPDRQKLSKRHGATSVGDLRRAGYLPEAVVNYLALLGWSSPDGSEMFTKEHLIEIFDLDRLSSHPAIFDQNKLDWLAKHYIINSDIERIFKLSVPYILETGLIDEDYLKSGDNLRFLRGVVELTRGYCACLSQIKEHIGYFLDDEYEISDDAMKFLSKPESRKVLEIFYDAAENADGAIDEEKFGKIAEYIIKKSGVKGKHLFMPLRAALTGRTSGPEIYFLLPVIGKERTLKRIKRAISLI